MCLNNNSFFGIIPFSLQNGTHCGLFARGWNRFIGIRDLYHTIWVKWQHQISSGYQLKIPQICWRYSSKTMETCFSFGIWIFANNSCRTFSNVVKWTRTVEPNCYLFFSSTFHESSIISYFVSIINLSSNLYVSVQFLLRSYWVAFLQLVLNSFDGKDTRKRREHDIVGIPWSPNKQSFQWNCSRHI